MRVELRYGKVRYVSFIILDIVCLLFSNYLAFWIYLNRVRTGHYAFDDYRSVMVIMVIIDLLITVLLNTLRRVLRRNNRRELLEGARHIGVSFVALAVVLFTLRQGSAYSRVTVYLAYLFYFLLFVSTHIVWKKILQGNWKKQNRETAILMTTDGFVEEGLDALFGLNIDVQNIWLLKNINKTELRGIAVVKSWEEAASVICWKMLDRVFIYGLDHQMVPIYLVHACEEMGLRFDLVDFNFRVIDVNTVKHEDPQYGSLFFLEGKRDIPFPIRRAYWITETEADLHRGFHAHKLNCQLLYCPYGKIDLILDDGQKRNTVTLDEPGKGLLLMPGLWREMVWRQSGSVLCVLASEYYDAQEYIRNYEAFLEYNRKYRDSADPLKQCKE